jgi:hypothetical protein
MRSRLFVVGAGVTFALALGASTAAQAAVTSIGSVHVNATPETGAGLTDRGCGNLFNPGPAPDGDPPTGTYGWVDYPDGYNMFFEYASTLASDPGYLPNFCNLSISNLNGVFEIGDPNDPGADGDGCLAIDTATGFIHDDTSSACNTQEYPWDEWNAQAVGTWHSDTLYEFVNDDVPGACLTALGGGQAFYLACGSAASYEQEFAWPDSGI